MADKGVKISRDSIRRLASAVRREERTPQHRRPAEGVRIAQSVNVYGVIMAEVEAGDQSENEFGEGTMDIQETYVDDVTGKLKWKTTGTEVPVFTGAEQSIPPGVLVMCKMVGGRYHVDTRYC